MDHCMTCGRFLPADAETWRCKRCWSEWCPGFPLKATELDRWIGKPCPLCGHKIVGGACMDGEYISWVTHADRTEVTRNSKGEIVKVLGYIDDTRVLKMEVG